MGLAEIEMVIQIIIQAQTKVGFYIMQNRLIELSADLVRGIYKNLVSKYSNGTFGLN